MHGSVGLHSAMAIKRQRRAREEKRRRRLSAAGAGDRRFSSPTTSLSSLDHRTGRKRAGAVGGAPPDHRLATSIGMLHLGVVFLVLGLFLIGSGLLPDDYVSWRGGGWWNELVASGLFASALGVFLISLNRVMSKKEEDDLNEYVQTQLTRSRSGHRLERDTETGCLTTKQHRRHLQMKREDIERGITDDDLPAVHNSPPHSASPHTPNTNLHFNMPVVGAINGDAGQHLEKILEEEVSEREIEEFRRAAEYELFNKETMSTTTTASLSPGSPSETRELLNNGRYMHMARI